MIGFLVAVEQGIKLLINNRFLDADVPILKPFLYFDPMFNRDYSWFNSMLKLGVGKWLHVVLVTAMILFILLFYAFLHHHGKTSRLVDTSFAFLISGALCSWIDKVLWDGSLDYIELKGFFTFDLKDVYINVFIGLLLLMIAIDHQGMRKVDDRAVIETFLRFIRRK